jgi:hypothetical protein
MTTVQDLMACKDLQVGVSLYVHKCITIVDAAAEAAARQQP